MKQVYPHGKVPLCIRLFFVTVFLLSIFDAKLFAQSVGIGTTTPDANAQLDVSSNTKGILIPRLTSVQRSAIVNPAKGLIVYDSTSRVIFYYDGIGWQGMSNSSNAWSLNGNSGSDPNSQFIGTSDNKVLQIRVNNIRAGLIDHLNQNLFLGNKAGFKLPAGSAQNLVLGDSAFSNAKLSSSGNTIIGYGAQSKDTIPPTIAL